MKYYAILVAGGSGNRMQSKVAKQFLLLNGKPVLMHTIKAFFKCPLNPEILVVLNKHQHVYWEELCRIHHFDITHRIIEGGEKRFNSVKNGLDAILQDGIVAVHDAVRPLISTELILRCFREAEKKGNCIVGITPTDSIRKVSDTQESVVLNRKDFILVQTPQTFNVNLLKKSYQLDFKDEFTDDASVVEYSGVPIHVIEGERENIKITYPEDLEIASILLNKKEFA